MNYVDPALLKDELNKFRLSYNKETKLGNISDELGTMFLLVAQNMANRRNFINYTYKDDMISMGLEHLCKYAHNYDKDHPKANAFAYVSQICYNGFSQCIKSEKKKSKLKDIMIKKIIEVSDKSRTDNKKTDGYNDRDNYDYSFMDK